jgi:hypothetical protein
MHYSNKLFWLKVTLVLTIEETYFEESKRNILNILEDMHNFEEILIYAHPRGEGGH